MHLFSKTRQVLPELRRVKIIWTKIWQSLSKNHFLNTYDKNVNKWKIHEWYIWNSYPHPWSSEKKKIQKDIDKIGQQKWFDHSGEAKIMWEILQWEKISQQINLIKFELIFKL